MTGSFDNNQREISYKEILFLIKSNFKILLLTTLFCLVFGSLYLFIINPTYTSEGSIMIEDGDSTMNSIFDMSLTSDMNYLENEIEILKSRTTSERTINKLLENDLSDDMLFFETKQYNYGWLPGKGIRGILRKIFLLDWERNEIHDIKNTINDSLFSIYVEKLAENATIRNLRNTDVLKISFKGDSPEEASLIVNTLIEVYQERDQEWANDEMSHLKDFLNDQLRIKEEELHIIEEELKVFQETEHIYSLDENSEILLNQLNKIETDYHTSLANKNILIEKKRYFQSKLTSDEKEFAENVSNTLNTQLIVLRDELSKLEAEYTAVKSSKDDEEHPAAQKLKKKIELLKKNLNFEINKYIDKGVAISNPIEHRQALMDSLIQIDASIQNFNSKLNEIDTLVKKYESELSSLPSKFLIFSKLQRDRVILDQTYTLMKQKFEESRISEASQLGKVRVVDPAIPIYDSTSPNNKLVLMLSFCLGLFLGLIFILFNEYMDSTIKSIEELEKRGLSVLAVIPSIGSDEKRKKRKKGYRLDLKLNNTDKIERRLLTHEDPKSPISESYRSLRTSLMFREDQESTQTILVSSSGPGEGKTTTVANLAITYANMGKKTILIDADLRKPVVRKMFNLRKNLGLTNYIVDSSIKLSDITFSSPINNLDILPSGVVPPNPSELLDSQRMKELVEKLNTEYDVVLFDSPPLIAVTDAMILKKYCDKFLLVVRASATQKGALDRVLIGFENIQESIHGAVFNGVDEKNSYGSGYYYNYYQYYYGKDS